MGMVRPADVLSKGLVCRSSFFYSQADYTRYETFGATNHQTRLGSQGVTARPFALISSTMILSEKFGPLEVQNRTAVCNFNAGLFREDGTQCPPSLLPTLSPK